MVKVTANDYATYRYYLDVKHKIIHSLADNALRGEYERLSNCQAVKNVLRVLEKKC